MSAKTQTRARRIVRRVTRTWAELDYAQRRLIEIRTGVPQLTRHEHPLRGQVRHLDAHLYELPDRD